MRRKRQDIVKRWFTTIKEEKMKKIIFLNLFLLFISSIILPRVITYAEAEEVALKWVDIENHSQELRLTKEQFISPYLSELIYNGKRIGYIAEMFPGGFFIMPAISELSPVKFLSYAGKYENIKNHPFIKTIKYRLYYSFRELGYGSMVTTGMLKPDKSNTIKIDVKQRKKNETIWQEFFTGDMHAEIASVSAGTAVGPLLTSKWGQENPYNMYTPRINRQETPTGCTATAQAQVMYYWKYPKRGQGSHSYTWKLNGQTLSANFNHDYFWNQMTDEILRTSTQQEKESVARLMSDVGISIDMEYAPDGSGAHINTNNSLVKFFKYSPDIKTINRSYYVSWAKWFDVFKNQVDKKRPALLAAYKPNKEGHSVVVDGYRIQNGLNQVHVNMGWDGMEDNYYTMDDIYGYGNKELDYACIDIHPEVPPGLKITYPQNNSTVHGIVSIQTVTTGDVDKIEYYINGALVQTDSNQSTYNSFNWDSTTNADGQCIIKAIAYSLSGQKSEDTVTVNVDNIVLTLQASRNQERAWTIRKLYGKIDLSVQNKGSSTVSKYILYRKVSGSTFQSIAEIPGSQLSSGNYVYYDKYLGKNENYTYKCEAVLSGGTIIDVSNEINI